MGPPSSSDHSYPNMEERSASAASKSSATMPTWNWSSARTHRSRAVHHTHARTILSISEKWALRYKISCSPPPGESLPDLEDRRGRRHHAVVVALVVEGQADTDLAGRAADRLAVGAEGPGLATGQEHDVPGLHLQQVGAGEPGGQVDRGGLEHDVLRPDVQRRVGRGELDGKLGQDPVAVAATGGAERLPQRRQAGRVDDLQLVLVHFLQALRRGADPDPLALGERDDAAPVVGVDDLRPAVPHPGPDLRTSDSTTSMRRTS